MRRCIRIFFLLMICLVFASCSGITPLSDSDADIYAKIHKRYSKMTSYTSEVTICAKGNKTENIYTAKQYYISPDKMLTVFDDGLKILINGAASQVKMGDNEAVFSASDDIYYLFINEFFRLYYLSQDTALSVANHSAGSITRLTAYLPSAKASRYKLVLTINNKTLSPDRLSVCDAGGNEVLYADFKSFIINDKIDEEIFS